ncbi:MAG: hypothetical protein OSA98_01010 [Rubripirellula sp.]|nr:hypothetical protein [Rubripirellula sp.]
MNVIVYDPAGKCAGKVKMESFEELGQEVERLIKEGSLKENYYLECQRGFLQYRWKIRMGGEGLFLEKMASGSRGQPKTPGKPPLAPYRDGWVPEESNYQTQFDISTAWSGFWYFVAAANLLIALVSLFAFVSGSSLAFAFCISSSSTAIFSLFFGWISEVANHIRWLLSEQLKELKRPQS